MFNTPNAHNPRNEVKICALQLFVMQISDGEIILFDTENKDNISSHAIIFTVIQSPICPPAVSMYLIHDMRRHLFIKQESNLRALAS